MELERQRSDRLSLSLVMKMISGLGMPIEFFEEHRKSTVAPGVSLEMFVADLVLFNGMVLSEGCLVRNRLLEDAKLRYAEARLEAEKKSMEVVQILKLPERHDSHF